MNWNRNRHAKYKSSVVLLESTDIKFLCQMALKVYKSLRSLSVIILSQTGNEQLGLVLVCRLHFELLGSNTPCVFTPPALCTSCSLCLECPSPAIVV